MSSSGEGKKNLVKRSAHSLPMTPGITIALWFLLPSEAIRNQL